MRSDGEEREGELWMPGRPMAKGGREMTGAIERPQQWKGFKDLNCRNQAGWQTHSEYEGKVETSSVLRASRTIRIGEVAAGGRLPLVRVCEGQACPSLLSCLMTLLGLVNHITYDVSNVSR